CMLSIASGSDLTYPPAWVDRRYFTAQAALACCRYLQRAPRRGLTAIILRPEIGAAPIGAALLCSRVNRSPFHAARDRDELAGDVTRKLIRCEHDDCARDIVCRCDLAQRHRPGHAFHD